MNIRAWLVGLLLSTVLLGCGDAEEQKAKYLDRGKSFYAEENFEKARVEFKNVLQIDPKDVEARENTGQGRHLSSALFLCLNLSLLTLHNN